MIINAKDYGITIGNSIGKELNSLLESLRGKKEDVEIVFESGDYYIDSEDVPINTTYITNTIGEKEWRRGEVKNHRRVAINMSELQNVKLNGNGACFHLRGVMTNVVIEKSSNITISNLQIDTVSPNLHEVKVTRVSSHSFDFHIDEDSTIEKKGNQYYFVGKDYEYSLYDSRRWSWWTAFVEEDTPNKVVRHAHPLAASIGLKRLGEREFRAYTILKPSAKVGNRYYLFDVRRKDVGIFIDRSSNITLDSVEQNFNYSLAIVAQNSENLYFKSLRLAPNKDKDFKMCSIADFVHLCMCRGEIVVRDSEFIGAGDDTLNVHGIHFKVTAVKDKSIVVKFMHSQTYGFNPFRVGDSINYIDIKTLLPHGGATITDVKMLSDYEIELMLDNMVGASTNYVIEDVSANPSLLFENNYTTRIITRGILVTTRKAKIINNVFDSCSMHSILFSDDAKNWYESGYVDDVLIEGNTFRYTPMYNICIMPENSEHQGSVHGKFVVRNNKFEAKENGGIYVKSTKYLELDGNSHIAPNIRIDEKNVEKIINND